MPELTKRLKDLIKMQKKRNDPIPEKPDLPSRKRKEVPVVGTVTEQRKNLECKSIADEDAFDKDSRVEWKNRESRGVGSILGDRQQIDAPKLEDLIGERIEYYSEYHLDESGTTTDTG